MNKTQVNVSCPRFDIRQLEQPSQFTEQYLRIYQENVDDKKWILFINPEDDSLNQLNKINTVDKSKILKVDPSKHLINMKNIKSVLCQGNCAAVVLCNTCLEEDQINELRSYAQSGKTDCVILNRSESLH